MYNHALREIILLEAPKFAECSEGNCAMRTEYSSYLQDGSSTAKQGEVDDEGFKPFADLDITD